MPLEVGPRPTPTIDSVPWEGMTKSAQVLLRRVLGDMSDAGVDLRFEDAVDIQTAILQHLGNLGLNPWRISNSRLARSFSAKAESLEREGKPDLAIHFRTIGEGIMAISKPRQKV